MKKSMQRAWLNGSTKTLINRMRVLFVCSGNSGISPIIEAQAKSLRETGLHLEITPIIGKGFWGYLSSLSKIRKQIKEFSPKIIHAHYSFCGIVVSLATRKPVITSLMGSDVKSSGLWRIIIRYFVRYVWHITIVKSEDMKKSLDLKTSKIHVIPNGVDLNLFKPMDKIKSREKLGWDLDKRIVLFAANPKRPEKNYNLAKAAIDALDRKDVELKVVYDVAHECMPLFMNAADTLLLTSLWEGSPNVVKEAMACNTPVVSTDVGDIKELFGDTVGCSIANNRAEDVCRELVKMLDSDLPAEGRVRIKTMGIDSQSVARKIFNL